MTPVRILIVGHGRMGRLVETLAASHGCVVAGIVDGPAEHATYDTPADVAIDFSVGDAVPDTLSRLAASHTNVVIGTTGWQAHEAAMRAMAARAGIGVMASPNFAIGMTIFRRVVETAAALFAREPSVGAWIHESHHAAKKDAPSGTALTLAKAIAAGGYARAVDVSSTRAGSLPGTHTVGFDDLAETVTLTHTVRDRSVFAHGALEAAVWLRGRVGWFGVEDMLTGSAASDRS